MQVIIDRFEGDYAVVEFKSKTYVNLPRILVPEDAREGDILEIHKIQSDRKCETAALMEQLFED